MIVRLLDPQVSVPDDTRIFLVLAIDPSDTTFAVPFGFRLVSAIVDKSAELAARHFVTTEPERFCDSDAMLGSLGGGWRSVAGCTSPAGSWP